MQKIKPIGVHFLFRKLNEGLLVWCFYRRQQIESEAIKRLTTRVESLRHCGSLIPFCDMTWVLGSWNFVVGHMAMWLTPESKPQIDQQNRFYTNSLDQYEIRKKELYEGWILNTQLKLKKAADSVCSSKTEQSISQRVLIRDSAILRAVSIVKSFQCTGMFIP